MSFAFLLNIPSLSDNPMHRVDKFFTIGSQEGDLLINDPTVEGKHCSFIVNDNVVSVIDHNSGLGTYIDGQRIPSERFVILMNGDKLKIGDVAAEVKFQEGDMSGNLYLYQLGSQASSEAKSIEQLFVDQIIKEVDMAGPVVEEKPEPSGKISATQILKLHATKEISPEDKTSDNIPIPKEFKAPKNKKSRFKLELNNVFSKSKKVKVEKVKVMKVATSYGLTEAIFRFISFGVEIVIAGFIYQQMLQDQSATFDGILSELNTLIAIPDIEFIFTEYKQLIINLIIFSILRIISVTVFSVSYTQFVLSFVAQTEGSNARIGGFIREAMGFILLPLCLILDPIFLLIGRPTLKELISRCSIGLKSKVSAFVYSTVLIPSAAILFVINPLLKDFSLKEEILFATEKKAAKEVDQAISFQNSLLYELQIQSSFESGFEVLPIFSVQGELLETELLFVHKQDDISFKLKRYDHKLMQQLLRKFQQTDIFIGMFYPLLDQALLANQFKNEGINVELQDLLSRAFSLNLMGLVEHISSRGPSTNAYVDFRETLIKSLDISLLDKVTIVNQLGNDHIRIDSHIPKKAFQIFYIPISLAGGPLVRVEIVASYEKSLEIANSFFINTKKLPKINKDELTIQHLTAMGLLDSLHLGQENAATHIQNFFTEKKKAIIATNPVNFDDFKLSANSAIKFIKSKMKPLKAEQKVAWEQAIDTLELLIK